MTEQIKVVVADRSSVDINKLSETEREIVFNTIAEANPDIPRIHFEAFADMQTEIIKYENRQTKPGIVELLLRRLVDTSIYISEHGQLLLVPVVRDYKIQTQFGKKQGGYTGGVIAKHVKALRQVKLVQKAKTREVDPKAIRARFDRVVYSVTTANRPYLIPPGEEVDVYGVKLFPVCKGLDIGHELSYRVPDADRMRIGIYGVKDVIASCDLVHGIDAGATPKTEDLVIIEANTPNIKRLDEYFRTMSNIDKYLLSPDATAYLFAQVANALHNRKAKPALIESVHSVKHVDINLDPGFSTTYPKASMEFLTFIESLLSMKFSTRYALSVIADLWSMGQASLFQSAGLYGRESPRVIGLTNQLKQRKARIELQSTIRLRHIQELYRTNVYKLLIERKLGTPRYLEVMNLLESSPADILSLLKPQERKLVEIEYSKRQRYLEEVVNNKCPHVKMMREFRSYRFDQRAKRKLDDIRTFMDVKKNKGPDAVIKCNNCGFDLICPHMVEYAELLFRDKPFNEVKMRMNKYIDSVVTSNYYCKLCGEVIAEVDVYGDVAAPEDAAMQNTIDDDLRKTMYGEIIVAIKQVDFGALVNVHKVINTIMSSIYEFVFEIEKQLLKAKTNTADDVKNKKRLFITIYAYAYLMHLMLSHKSNKDKNLAVEFKGMPKTTSPADYIRHAIKIIVFTKNIILNQMPSITHDFIKEKLIAAYKNIASKGSVSIQLVGEAESLFNILELDPLYRYIYNIWCLDKGKFSRDVEDFVDKIPTILDISPTAKDVKTDPYLAVKPLDPKKWRVNEFMTIAPVKNGVIFTGSGKKRQDVYDTMHGGYVAASFNQYMKRIYDRVFEKHIYADYALTKTFADHFADCDKVLAAERNLQEYRKMYNARVHQVFRHDTDTQYRKVDVPLGHIYDENGNLHAWSTLVYEIDDKKVEKTVKDLEKMLIDGVKLDGRKLVDKKCGGCGVYMSAANKLSEAKIRASLSTKSRIGNFFKFYEARCPTGGLHEFAPAENSLVCKKCTFDFNMSFAHDAAASVAFFSKYETAYVKDLSTMAESGDEQISPPKPAEDLSRFEEPYKKYAFNFNVVLDLAGKLKINSHAIMCLAATEGKEYADVLSGAFIPPEADTRDDYRIYQLDAYMKTLLVSYNNLRFFHTFSKPPVDIARILDETGYSKHEHAKLEKLLPDIYDDYQDRFKWFREHKKPREIVEFLIETFVSKCLFIIADKTSETKKVRDAYAKYIVGKILRIDELKAKAGEFKWELIHPEDRSGKDDVAYDENTDKDRGVEEEVDDDDDDEETEEGTTDRPLKNNFDIDYLNDPGEQPDEDNADDFETKHEGYEDLS